MAQVLVGDLFQSGAQTLVNTVNCVGVMGKGVALEFKKRFPDMHEDYVARCAANQVRLGEPYLFRRPEPPWVLNFPTKGHWRAVSRLSDIVAGLEYLENHYRDWGITSLAVPPLGCGQGGLEWRVVGPVLLRYLDRLDIPVKLYAPQGTPQAELDLGFLSANGADGGSRRGSLDGPPKLNPAWVALVEILARINAEPYHWPVGRILFQKIAYFATEAGLPTGLRYTRGSYGPFAPDLKMLETRLVNNGLVREQEHGRMFVVNPGPTYQDAAQAYRADLERWEPIIARIVDLFLRMRTDQAEVAATAHFAAAELAQESGIRPSEAQVLDAVRNWKARRRPPLTDEQVALAIRNLNLLGWLDVGPSTDLPLPTDALVEA
jgi:O-acetyl-ADP-ribose deacetylase (regulator of RNase III)/uncharacterized protein YwgA